MGRRQVSQLFLDVVCSAPSQALSTLFVGAQTDWRAPQTKQHPRSSRPRVGFNCCPPPPTCPHLLSGVRCPGDRRGIARRENRVPGGCWSTMRNTLNISKKRLKIKFECLLINCFRNDMKNKWKVR